MEINCPPGIKRSLCLERQRLLLRLRTTEMAPPPPADNAPPLPPVDVVDLPLPPQEDPTPTSDVINVAGTWSRGPDVVTHSSTYGFVVGPPASTNGLIGVSDLMGNTHTGPLPIL